jgi:hypothetical protein
MESRESKGMRDLDESFISVLRRSSVKLVKWLASASHPQNPGRWLAVPACANLRQPYISTLGPKGG